MKKHALAMMLIFICGLGLGLARAEIPALAEVSTKLPEAEQKVFRKRKMELEVVLKKFLAAGQRFNDKPAKAQSDEEFAALNTQRAQRIAAAQQFNSEMASRVRAALAADIKQASASSEAQDKALSQAIERDLTAVRNFGFDRRAQDFEEWEKLATDAKREFEHTVSTELAGLLASKAKDGILAGVKGLDEAKVGGWIAVLMKQDPPPTEIIAVLRRMAFVADMDRVKLATDAKYLAKLIENMAKSAKVSGWKGGMPVLLDIVCEAFPPEVGMQGKMFKATATSTVASLYNNAARRVAKAEIERLTSLTESQLKALANVNGLIEKHVKERREAKSKLKEQ